MINLKKSLGTLFPAMRISFALVLLTTCVLFSAEMLGFTPNEAKFKLEAREKISESLAIQFSILAPTQDIKKIKRLLRYFVKRNSEILSAGIRLESGLLIFQSGEHDKLWENYKENESTSTHVLVPLFQKALLWGNVEIRFAALDGESLQDFFNLAIFKMSAFIILIGFFVYLVFMLRTLRQLDPSAVIPERVNAAFDTLAEGVIIIDENEQIILTNKAFDEKISAPTNSLLGFKISELKWERISKHKSGTDYPWVHVLKSGKTSVGSQLILKSNNNKTVKFAINASPIAGEKDKSQGVLITLDDITELEERNTELQTMVVTLEETHAQVKEQNKELHYLATRDPMTGCLNRRAFFEQFDIFFDKSKQDKSELSCLMIDLDHFKLVNDNYGHGVGDEVIKLLAEILQSSTRKIDLVGRYGGEEFCVVLPGLTTAEAFTVAERIRLRMKDESTNRFKEGPRVTASIGVASIFDNPANPSELNNLADEALYVAKDSGRNRVIIWQPESEINHPINEIESQEETTITEEIPPIKEVSDLKNRIIELESLATKFSAELEYSKNYDSLTGLPNQLLLYDRIFQAIERGIRHDQLVAVVIVDVSIVSQINSTLGLSIADSLIQKTAERMESVFRKCDGISRLTISRFTNDEFAVLLTDITDKNQVTWIIKRLLEKINHPVEIGDNTVYLTSNIGISLYPTDANTVDEILNNAIAAKQYCKNYTTDIEYQFFDKQIQEQSIKHLQLDTDIRQAIKNEEWQLLYQPKLDITHSKIIGVEALIRWKHPQRGLLSPYEFIDFAEQRGLIIPIGDWVLKQACHQIKQWNKQGLTDCKIAINLSSAQLMQTDIVQKVFETLDHYEIPPRQIELEVTETTLMDNLQVAIDSLQKLNSRGISIAIDDFGTGYSSLSYLKSLPIDCLKIDRTFIMDICHDEKDKQIVQTLISMAHSMGLSVVAEGVEDKNQLDLLRQYSCDIMQGYLLSKPITADAIVKMMSHPEKFINTFCP